MPTITPELRRAIEEAGDTPIRVEDPETRRTYVLIPAEQFERLKSLVAGSDVDDMYPFIAEVFGPEGWDDPAMDVYNDLDPRP